jgi:hypothetical protein
VNDEFYQLPVPQLTQGDILNDVPAVYVGDGPLEFIRRRDTPRGPTGDIFVLGDGERAPQQAFKRDGDEFVGNVQQARAMILTHSCELDNSPRATVTLVLIRPMRNLPDEAKSAIREGRNLRLLYLPANDEPPLEESYVDLSRVTSIRRGALNDDQRYLSATRDLLLAVYMGIVKYYTRFEVDEESLVPLVERALEGTE